MGKNWASHYFEACHKKIELDSDVQILLHFVTVLSFLKCVPELIENHYPITYTAQCFIELDSGSE